MIDQAGKDSEAFQIGSESCMTATECDAVDGTSSMQLGFNVSSNGSNTEPPHSRLSGSDLQLHSVPQTEHPRGADPRFPISSDRYAPTTVGWNQLPPQVVSPSIFHSNQATPLSPESIRESSLNSNPIQQEIETLEDKLRHVGRKFTVEQILNAGLKALSQQSSSRQTSDEEEESASQHPLLRTDKIHVFQNPDSTVGTVLPDLHRNNFRVKQVMWVAACVANAAHLGVTMADTNCDDGKSPFFRQSVSYEVAKTTCQNSFKNLKEQLRPTLMQVMHQHHPYIDVLPFPTFRERVIKLVYVDEPMIDEDDLCNDLENDGLICWGSSLGGGSMATGSGAPWDIRSWEAQPWFLRKWWILVGGAEGELYKQTQWWREMRGERQVLPW